MNKLLFVVVCLSVMIFSIQSAPTGNSGDTSDADIDWGCTLSCGIWNGCRVIAMKNGNLNSCGPQPSGCDCTHFAG